MRIFIDEQFILDRNYKESEYLQGIGGNEIRIGQSRYKNKGYIKVVITVSKTEILKEVDCIIVNGLYNHFGQAAILGNDVLGSQDTIITLKKDRTGVLIFPDWELIEEK
jgi:hypothetical protein